MARPDGGNPLRTGIFGIALVACLVLVSFGYTQLPFWPQGKQIFNPYDLKDTVPAEGWSKDFDIPASAAYNLRIEPTADQ